MKPYQLPSSLRVQGVPTSPAAPPPSPPPSAPAPVPVTGMTAPSWSSGFVATVYGLLSLAGTAAGAYHGVRRNHGSIWSAVAWGFLGGVAPLITVPVAVGQGFGKPREDDKPDSTSA